MESAEDVGRAKAALRSRLLAARAGLSVPELAHAAHAIAETILAMPEIEAARCVGAYVSVGREPGTRHLLDVLAGRGVLVLVPVLLADGSLDWAEYESSDALLPAARGLLEPTGPRVGVDAIRRAEAVLVPALGVDRSGNRLGRGGGSYDRALCRTAADALLVALVHEGGLLPGGEVPAEPHDVPVHAVVTPTGSTRFVRRPVR